MLKQLDLPQIFRLIFDAEPECLDDDSIAFIESNHDVFGHIDLSQEFMDESEECNDTMFTLTVSPGAILSVSLAELPPALHTEVFVAGQLASQLTQYYADLADKSHRLFKRRTFIDAVAALAPTPES